MSTAGSARRWCSRLAAASALTCLVTAIIVPVGAQDEPAGPDVFRSSASAFVAQAFLDRDGLLPVNEALRFIALDGEASYESSNQRARSSILYPGNGVVSGPSLACGTFGSQLPAELEPVVDACLQYEYPLTVRADALDPDRTTVGSLQLGAPGDALSGQAVRASAHADADATTTEAVLTELRVLGLPEIGPLDLPVPLLDDVELDPSLLTVEHASSRTDQRIDAEGRLRSEAESLLQGVRLLGGLVEISSLRSTAAVIDDGTGGTSQTADVAVGDVTVGGLAAELTDNGLQLGSPTGAPLVDQLTGLVNELLAALSVRVSALDVEHGVDDEGIGFARASGLLVEFDVDVDGLPVLPGPLGDIDPNGIYQGVVQLGAAGVTGVAHDIEAPAFTPTDPTASAAATVPVTSAPGSTAPPGAASGHDRSEQQAMAPANPTGSRQLIVRSVGEDWADRLRLVYLAFTLMALAVCLAPRFAIPARLPGAPRES